MKIRPRVLLIAEACNPTWTSVPLEGWSCSQAISELADAHLVTHIRNRDALRDAGLHEGEDFTAIDSDRVAAPMHWLASKLRGGSGRGWTTVAAFRSLAYYYFEHLVWKRFAQQIKDGQFDVVHRLTPITPTAPSLLAKRCAAAGVPFVLGPLNGGLPWPRDHEGARRREGEWLVKVRELYRCLPGHRSTRKHAAAIIVGSSATSDQLGAAYRHKCVYIPENGVDPARFTAATKNASKRPLRIAFVGRLVAYKNPGTVIEAIAPLAKAGQVECDLYGDGPLRDDLAAMITTLGVENRVRLRGWVDHEQLGRELSQTHLFAFPSVREFGGAVVVEAMAMGVVPIVVDYGGPGELISPACGFGMPLSGHDALVANLRKVIADVVAQPAVLEPMRQAGINRVRRWFTWQTKAQQIVQVYRWVMGDLTKKPDWGMPLRDSIEAVTGSPSPAHLADSPLSSSQSHDTEPEEMLAEVQPSEHQ